MPVPNVVDGPAVAFVRPHDILVAPLDAAPTEDALLPGEAVVRFVSALGPRAALELLYEKRLIEAEMPRPQLEALGILVGEKCRIRVRLPTIFPKTEVDSGMQGDRRKRRRLRLRPERRRAATT
jgi:sulfate transport system ATP-binding protein